MHNSISGTGAPDRLAIRELIEAYAHCADRRDAKGQMSLFCSGYSLHRLYGRQILSACHGLSSP